MNYYAILIQLIASIASAVGSLFLKKSAAKFKINIKKLLKNNNLIIGVLLYLITTILCIYALSMEDLSILYPVLSLSYVWVALLSIKFLREKMNFYKWLGIGLIIVGVIFITV
jgi:drug/metabolite transporter (DMT)-like permease